MLGHQVSDKDLSKTANKRLVRSGAPTKVMATVSKGTITLTGELKYEAQRKQIVKAMRSTPGVLHVMDQLQSPPKRKAV